MSKIKTTRTDKTVGNSIVPLFHQLPTIAENLREKLGISFVDITISISSHDHLPDIYYVYKLCFQPGLDKSECSVHEYDSWSKLLTHYCFIMRSK